MRQDAFSFHLAANPLDVARVFQLQRLHPCAPSSLSRPGQKFLLNSGRKAAAFGSDNAVSAVRGTLCKGSACRVDQRKNIFGRFTVSHVDDRWNPISVR